MKAKENRFQAQERTKSKRKQCDSSQLDSQSQSKIESELQGQEKFVGPLNMMSSLIA